MTRRRGVHGHHTLGHGHGARPVPARAVLRTDDGVLLEAAYLPRSAPDATGPAGGPAGQGPRASERPGALPGVSGPRRDAPVLVLAHGFTGSLRRPALRRAAATFARHAAVVTFSFRGHGRSAGRSTLGDREVADLAAAVRWARSLGHHRVATVGFSMGGSVVVRHAALHRPPGAPPRDGPPPGTGRPPATDTPHGTHTDAAVTVSAPARWFYRGTAPMRRLHLAVEHPAGRLTSRLALRTRVHPGRWDPVPLSPVAAAPLVAPVPLLVVHGDRDAYFPLDHPYALAAAGDPRHTELWLEPGFGHAENAAPPELLHRIAGWAVAALARPPAAQRTGTTSGPPRHRPG